MIDLGLLFDDELHFRNVGEKLGMIVDGEISVYTLKDRILTAEGLDQLKVPYPPEATIFFNIPFKSDIKVIGTEHQHDGPEITDKEGNITQPTKKVSFRVNVRCHHMPPEAEVFLAHGLNTAGVLIWAKQNDNIILGSIPPGAETFA